MELGNQFYTIENSDLMDIEGGSFWGGFVETFSGVVAVVAGVAGFIIPEPIATKVGAGFSVMTGAALIAQGINDMQQP